jgi:23S rRNA (guanosine2251-2'-O)-methyltransferase
MSSSIRLKNPHSALAVLETRPEDFQQIVLPYANASGGDAWDKVIQLAKQKRISISTAAPKSSQPARGSREVPSEGRANSIEAVVKERAPLSTEELFENAREKRGGHGLWLALDSLQDPHNMGAIFRAAAFFGVEGIMITQERSVPLTGTVYDVASGGLEYVPFTMQINLQRGFEIAKDAGLWILGTSEHAHDDLKKIARDRPWLLVFGNEEKGMRRLTQESCDQLCKISPQGKVLSLNVSVAAGICISHLS